MRLLECARVQVALAARAHAAGALGGRAEVFSDSPVLCWGSVLPQPGKLEAGEAGLRAVERLRILLPSVVAVSVGDCAIVENRRYRIYAVQRWSAHLELDCEALRG